MKKEDSIEPLGLSEETFEEYYIIPSYFFRSTKDSGVYEKAKSFAGGQTMDTWLPVPGITNEMKEKHGERITAIHDIPPEGDRTSW